MLDGVDLTNFWESFETKDGDDVEEPIADVLVASVERKLGYKLPRAYVELMRSKNGGYPRRTCHRTSTGTTWASDHIQISSIFAIGSRSRLSLCGDTGSQFWSDEWDYPAIDRKTTNYLIPIEVICRHYVAGSLWDRISSGNLKPSKLGFKSNKEVKYGDKIPEPHIEVTTKVIRRAVGTCEVGTAPSERHTFQGMDLMLSLGNILSGAVPLLLNQDPEASDPLPTEEDKTTAEIPIGAKIIRTVRAYLALVSEGSDEPQRSPAEAFELLRNDPGADHDETVLRVLERIVTRPAAKEATDQLEEVAAVPNVT